MTSHHTSKSFDGMFWKLFFLLALQFFIWGAWYPGIYTHLLGLRFTSWQQSCILSAFPIAAIVGLLVTLPWVDRSDRLDKVLAFSHFAGGLMILGCGFTTSFWPFFLLMLGHCLFYVPTISITYSIAFENLSTPQRQFGWIRMGGSLGLLVALWVFTLIFVDWVRMNDDNPSATPHWLGRVLENGLTGRPLFAATWWTFVVAGVASLLLAGYCLLLPQSMFEKNERNVDKGGLWNVLQYLRKPYMLILWIVAFIDSFVANCFFQLTGGLFGATREIGGVLVPGNRIVPIMSVGLIAELLIMFMLGGVLKYLGWRWTMVSGVLSHALGFLIYALYPDSSWLVLVIQFLNGTGLALFFVSLFIFVDANSQKQVLNTVQGLFNMMVLGGGVLCANVLCPMLREAFTRADQTVDYRNMFMVPAAVSGIAAIALALFFHPPKWNSSNDHGEHPNSNQPEHTDP